MEVGRRLAELQRMEMASLCASPATPSIKLARRVPIRGDLQLSLYYPCGRGDRQEIGERLAAPGGGARRGVCVHTELHALDDVLSVGDHQRQQLYTGVIFGDGSHSTPGSGVLPRPFFLLRGIFLDLGTRSITGAAPSGLHPGGGVGA